MRDPIHLVSSLLGSLLTLSACASDARDGADVDATSPADGAVDPAPEAPDPAPDEPEPEPVDAACGDGVVEGDELCDGAALDGASCESLGYASGALHCRLDCQGLRTDKCVLGSSQIEITAAGLDREIPDDAYDGSIASMACVDLVVPGAPKYGWSANASFELAIDHPWIGDLVVKLVAPSGRMRTYMHRPGRAGTTDDGLGAGGAGADLSSDHPIKFASGGFNSELMGGSIAHTQVVSKDDDICQYFAGSVPIVEPHTEEEFTGTWKVCVGDAAPDDKGRLAWVVLRAYGLTSSPSPRAGVNYADTLIPDGTYDGTLASMACLPMDVAGEPGEVAAVEARFHVAHPRASQLTFALLDPEGQAYTLMSRPTVDEDEHGAASVPGSYEPVDPNQLLAIHIGALDDLPSVESMGEGAAMVCANGKCDVAADPGGAGFPLPEEVIGRAIPGVWHLCLGDSVPGQSGTVYDASLLLSTSL